MGDVTDALPFANRIARLLHEIHVAGFDVSFDARGMVISAGDGHVRLDCDSRGDTTMITCLWSEL